MRRLALWLFIPLALAAQPALAACNVLGTNLAFGPYDPLGGAGSAVSGTITVSCDQSPAPTVTILIGPSAGSGSMAPRRMQQVGGSDSLVYNLYVNAQNSVIWGDGTGGTGTLSNRVQKNKPWTATIYGRVPGNQDVAVGAYTDAIGITINF